MIDLQGLQARCAALARALEAMNDASAQEERSALRRQIVDLYREVDGAVTHLAATRQSVQALGERFRRTFGGGSAVEGGEAGTTRGAERDAEGGGNGNEESDGDGSREGYARASAGGDEDGEWGRGDGSAVRPAEDLDVSTYLDRAWNCLATCRYEDALAEVTRALERVPASLQAETLRGWALMRLDRLDDARGVLEEVLRANSSAALARASLGYVAYREGRYSEAIDHLSRAARDGADRKAVLYAHLYLGMLYTRREMFRDGRSFLSRAIELGPSLVEAYWELGRSYYLEGQFTQALDTWTRGAAVNRFDPWGERCQEAVERAASGAPVLLE